MAPPPVVPSILPKSGPAPPSLRPLLHVHKSKTISWVIYIVLLTYYQYKFSIQCYAIFWLNWPVSKNIWWFLTCNFWTISNKKGHCVQWLQLTKLEERKKNSVEMWAPCWALKQLPGFGITIFICYTSGWSRAAIFRWRKRFALAFRRYVAQDKI